MEAKSSRKQDFMNVAMMGLFSAAVCVAGISHARGADAASAVTAATPAASAASASSDGARGERRAEFREKHHAALEACAKESGVALLPGKRPTKAERKTMDTCMTAKGFPHPGKGEHRGHGPRGKHKHGEKGAPPVGDEAPPAAKD